MSLWTWARSALAVAVKDFRVEFRARVAVNALLLFGITCLVMISFGVPAGSLDTALHSALLWVLVFFSAMTGLARAFAREEETGTANLLRLSCPPTAVFAGKLFFNWVLLLFLQLVLTPLYFGLLETPRGNLPLLAAILLLGGVGLAAGATVVAAIVAQARGGNALYTVLAFPILVPVLTIAVTATTLAIEGKSWAVVGPQLRVLVSYAGVVITLSLLLFDAIWTE